MQRNPVTSSMLASVGYDKDTETLEVEYSSGSVYQYDDVPHDVYEDLMQADSVGRFFRANILDAFPCSRLN